MTLPTFLGIGAPRSGSTWLYEMLRRHPDVYMSSRKEIYFFNFNYDRGFQEYEKFFPNEADSNQYQAIGEFTPNYLYCPCCPERIAKVASITKLMLILRNPVDRAYSQYGVLLKSGQYSGAFEDCLSVYPEKTIEHGQYSRWLKEYFRYFSREQFLILIMEDAVTNVSKTKETLAGFLEIEATRFSLTTGSQKVNPSYFPKSRMINLLVEKLRRQLNRRHYLAWVVPLVRRFGFERLFLANKKLWPPMKEETRQYLKEIYKDEISELEALIQMDLTCWR